MKSLDKQVHQIDFLLKEQETYSLYTLAYNLNNFF